MQIGISTDTIARQIRDEREAIRKYAEIGFETLDYSGYQHQDENSVYLKPDWEDYAKSLRETADACGIRFSQVHAPMMEEPGKDPAEDLKIELTRRFFRGSEILGAPYLVIHPRMFADGINGRNQEKYLSYNVNFYRQFIPLAEKHGIVIGLENMFGWDPEKKALCPTTFSTVEEILECMRRLDSDRFAVCLDTGHVNILGETPAAAARKIGSHLKLLHVHDNYGSQDEHMACGYGSIDWDAFLTALKECGYTGSFSSEAGGMGWYCPEEACVTAAQLVFKISQALLKRHNLR